MEILPVALSSEPRIAEELGRFDPDGIEVGEPLHTPEELVEFFTTADPICDGCPPPG